MPTLRRATILMLLFSVTATNGRSTFPFAPFGASMDLACSGKQSSQRATWLSSPTYEAAELALALVQVEATLLDRLGSLVTQVGALNDSALPSVVAPTAAGNVSAQTGTAKLQMENSPASNGVAASISEQPRPNPGYYTVELEGAPMSALAVKDPRAKRSPHSGSPGYRTGLHGEKRSKRGLVHVDGTRGLVYVGGSGQDIYDMVMEESGRPANPGRGSQSEEYRGGKVWNVIKSVKRHKRKHNKSQERHASVFNFFGSALVYEWFLFSMALMIFFPLFFVLQQFPATPRFHVIALFIWIGLGGLYNVAVWMRLGHSAGVMWFTGYLLEFIFSIENVFIFHIVVKAFRTPQRLTQKALFVVVCCQIIFEMVFMMGLAARVRSFQALPYILGVWLIYVGYHAVSDDGHDEFDIKNSIILRSSNWILGPRLIHSYDEQGSIVMFRSGKIFVSMLFPLICCLLAVDFLLEVDVTLTKIEELPNEYIAFTSSAAAAFAVPELFFVARDLFQRFALLKYGVSFVLLFYGVQMLMHTVFVIPDLAGCGIIVIVMIICMLLSSAMGSSKGQDHNICTEVKPKLCKEPMPEPPCKEVR